MHACDEPGSVLDVALRRLEHQRPIGREPAGDARDRRPVGERQLELAAAQRVERVGICRGAPRSRRRRIARTADAARRRASRPAPTALRARPPRGAATWAAGRRSRADPRGPHPRSCLRRAGSPGRRSARPARLRACGSTTTTSFGQRTRASTPSPCATRAAASPPTIASDASSAARPRRPQQHRGEHGGARTRLPAASPPPAAGLLHVGAHDRECGRALARQRAQLVLRRADALELDRAGRIDHVDTIGR